MEERKLASVQRVKKTCPIEGADKIELVMVLGWQCVAEKGLFQEGDLCVYFEIDAFLPMVEAFAFLRKSSYKKSEFMGEGYRLKTQRFLGNISQGLLQPLSILPDGDYKEGDDVTELLGVKKWEEPERLSSSGTIIGQVPYGITKTGELRIQSYPELIKEFKAAGPYYISTKCDGTSVTAYRKEGNFGVCGHNYEYADDGKCSIWSLFHEIKLEGKMKEKGYDNLAIQGEYCGEGIQKNRLKLRKPCWYVFTIIDLINGRRLGLRKMEEICKELSLTMVPIEEEKNAFPYDTVEDLLLRAKGKYTSGCNKEGIVIRPVEPVFSKTISGPLSMKVLNNDYLLKV